jgi:hypothetical protein
MASIITGITPKRLSQIQHSIAGSVSDIVCSCGLSQQDQLWCDVGDAKLIGSLNRVEQSFPALFDGGFDCRGNPFALGP